MFKARRQKDAGCGMRDVRYRVAGCRMQDARCVRWEVGWQRRPPQKLCHPERSATTPKDLAQQSNCASYDVDPSAERSPCGHRIIHPDSKRTEVCTQSRGIARVPCLARSFVRRLHSAQADRAFDRRSRCHLPLPATGMQPTTRNPPPARGNRLLPSGTSGTSGTSHIPHPSAFCLLPGPPSPPIACRMPGHGHRDVAHAFVGRFRGIPPRRARTRPGRPARRPRSGADP